MNEYEIEKENLKQTIRQFSKAGNYVEAIPYMERYCDLIKGHFGDDSNRYITVINDLGGMYRNVGNFEKSYETFNNALTLIEQKLGTKCEQYATTTVNLACMFRLTGDFEKAENMFLNALDIYDNDEKMQQILNSKTDNLTKEDIVRKSTLYANASNNLATLYQDLDKLPQSINLLTKSLELLKNTTNFEYTAISLCNLANAYMQSGNLTKAYEINSQSIKIFKDNNMIKHPSYLTALNNLGSIYFYKEEYQNALNSFETVEPLLKQTYGENSPQYQNLIYNITEVKSKLTNTSNIDIVNKIVEIEWNMFQKVNNKGGRASCQDNFNTFEIMRSSQYKAWSLELLESYLADLNNALNTNRNLITEKYARMMKHTHFLEYSELKNSLPPISSEREILVKTICELYKEQDDIYSKNYPKLRSTGRPIEPTKTATVDIYFEGEILTYSLKTLTIFKEYLEQLKANNENLPIKINDFMAKAYGYSSIDDAEAKL